MRLKTRRLWVGIAGCLVLIVTVFLIRNHRQSKTPDQTSLQSNPITIPFTSPNDMSTSVAPTEPPIQADPTAPANEPTGEKPTAPTQIPTAPTQAPTEFPTVPTEPAGPSKIITTVPTGQAPRGLLPASDPDSAFPMSGCTGNYNFIEAPVDYVYEGYVVTAKAVEILPDTYYFYDDWQAVPYRVIRMKTHNVLHGEQMVSDFYFMQKQTDSMDLLTYDAVILEHLYQFAYEDAILYNATAGAPQSMNMPVFICVIDDSATGYSAGSGATLEALEAEIMQGRYFERGAPSFQTLSKITSQEVKNAFTYIMDANNGLFIPCNGNSIFYQDSIQYIAQRYINGYQTTEIISIYEDSVRYTESKFTAEDIAALPDLNVALDMITEAFEAGTIAPPHIQNYTDLALWRHNIFGWYAKGTDGAYGIIRVSFAYKYSCYDDIYFIVTAESEMPQKINRDDLLALVGSADDYIYLGDYDINGMMSPGAYG